jgi:hypothetical protein
MPLPKPTTPSYEITLLSTGKPVKFRPFLVKEEKVLILAMESNDQSEITNAVKDILKSCILTKTVKIETLPSFDIEYLFLNIRSKSVGETVDVLITCPDDNETQVDHTVNIADVKVEVPEGHTDVIDLGDGLSLKMRYPSLKEFIDNNFNFSAETSKDAIEKTYEVVSSCIDQVYNTEESWSAADCTKKELIDYIETLTSAQFKEVEKFFQSMPKLVYRTEVTNPKTKVTSEVVIEGLSNFFA